MKHFAFSKVDECDLWKYVLENNIPANHSDNSHLVVVDLLASSEYWPWIENFIVSHPSHAVVCMSEPQFTKEELENAQWMSVRSIWRYGYPEPSADYSYEEITYTRKDYCPKCSVGLKQVDSFRIKKAPSWGRRHFFSLYWIEDEFFVNDTVKQIFQNENITGVSFLPVLNKTGKKAFEGIHQLAISHVLPEGLIESSDYLKKTTTCPECGTKKYCKNGCAMLRFKRECFEGAPDIVRSGDYFGGMPGIAAHLILINQKTYQAIIRNKLDRSLLFYPIELV